MKKLFSILLLCAMLIPLTGMAAYSPTIQGKITCEPALNFELLTSLPELEMEGYIILEAMEVELDKEYGLVEWHLLAPIDPDEQITVAIVAESTDFQEAEITPDGGVIVDFTGYEPGFYLLYFLRSDT